MDPFLIAQIAGMAAYTVLEYWLGKTDKTKAGSVLELVLHGVKYLAGKRPPA